MLGITRWFQWPGLQTDPSDIELANHERANPRHTIHRNLPDTLRDIAQEPRRHAIAANGMPVSGVARQKGSPLSFDQQPHLAPKVVASALLSPPRPAPSCPILVLAESARFITSAQDTQLSRVSLRRMAALVL